MSMGERFGAVVWCLLLLLRGAAAMAADPIDSGVAAARPLLQLGPGDQVRYLGLGRWSFQNATLLRVRSIEARVPLSRQ